VIGAERQRPRMTLARRIVWWRGWIALAWVVAAGLFLPHAGRVAKVLDVSARIPGSESAAVERLLAGPLASSYAHYGVLVAGGIPSPDTPEGVAVLHQIVMALWDAPQVAGVFSYADYPDSLFLSAGHQVVVR